MYLKSLEIQGFKSFPDKTVLNFDNDITAIVGPNGSGKSNISDAIRWVMGEQSTKALRGGKMEDVIFGGTQKRSQVGFAEATLVLDNSERAFSMDTPEIMVTRRYYRSGESEYYINKQSARLRDINELFMDTGLGREGYSNISQGRIDEILSVKSTDRREIFEEAAGISKYRHRKEETERRLAATEDNLVRIGDKISELELQVFPLKEQAEKAQKYLTYKDELEGLEVAVWLDSLEKLAQSAKKAEEDYNSAVFVLQQEHDALNSLYHQAETLGFDLHNRDLDIDRLREEISQAEAEGQRTDGQTAVLQGEEKNLQDNIRRVRQEIGEQDSRSSGIADQIAERRQRIAQIEAQSTELEQRLEQAMEEGRRLASSAEGMTRTYLEQRNRLSVMQAELAGKNADLAALRDTLTRSDERRAEVAQDQTAAGERRDETQKKLEQCRKELSRAREDAQACRNTLSGYELRRKTRQEKLDALQKRVNDLTVELDTTNSRLNMFREMEREYEGCSKAVRFVMQQAERGALRNVHGPVSRLIRTEDRYTVAVETALGAAMQHIVVSTEQDGKYAINLLKNRDCGRATFLPISAIEGRRLQEKGLESAPGFVGIASELVQCDEKYRPIVDNLLGRTVLCQDLDAAISMARRFGYRFKLVTLDGQVMNAGGSMTGGSVSKTAGVLSRANEIRRLETRQSELRQKKDAAQKELQEAARVAEKADFEMTAAQNDLRTAEDSVLKLEGEEKQYSVLFDAICDAADSAQRELAAIDGRRKQDEEKIVALQAQCELLQTQSRSLQAQIDEISTGQTAAAEQSSRLGEQITKLKMDAAALSAEKTTAADTVSQLQALAQSMQGDRSQKEALIANYEGQLAALAERLQQVAEQRRNQTAEIEAKKAKLQDALRQRMEVEAKKTRAEKDAQQKNKDIIDMERESARLEGKKNAAQMEEKQIIDKLWDSYELTPSLAPVMAAQIDSVTAANKRAAELRRKISALGTPNLGAIEEYARVSERYDYLTQQRDDVLESKKELESIVRDITRHMTDIFVEEFGKINHYFSQTFVEMFGGGKASLELEDADDPLGCGIEIKVQPPGKQLKTITLLSGGEKAFVAIALYFAILKVRPTPFCMLDEIDAALDDRNVERFASYLRSLCKKTQFIVITHRRGTMEEADSLFGVTMQEQGVSKILHLDLNSMEKQLGIVN